MFEPIKTSLKRSHFIVEVVRTIRAGILDLKVVYWLLLRGPSIRRYLHNNQIKKLQIGTSKSYMPGWLNTDLVPKNRTVIYLDASRRFPFRDDQFDYAFSEHMIEHINYNGCLFMLRECFRVLKPGGKLRLATPNLEILLGLYSKGKTAAQERFLDWVVGRNLPGVSAHKDVFVINNAFRAWGHMFLYDRNVLETALVEAGFQGLKFYKPGISDDECLRGIETHGDVIGSEEINQFETLVVECSVPEHKEKHCKSTSPGCVQGSKRVTRESTYA